MSRQDDQQCVTPLSHLPTEKADEFDGWHWDPAYRKRMTQASELEEAPAVEEPCHGSRNSALDERAQRFLKAVVDNPGEPSSAVARLAGLGTHQAIAIRKQLINQGYLREHRVATGGRGRNAKVLEPLPKAMELLES